MSSLPLIDRRFSRLLLLALTLAANCDNTTEAGNISWTGGDGNWSNALRWQPFGNPGPADFAFIGNAGIAETTVSLDQNDAIAGLVITNQMRLNTEGNTLLVSGATSIDGGAGFFTNDSRLNILQGSIVTTQDLTLSNGGSVFLDDGRYDITGTATIGAESLVSGRNGSSIRLFKAAGPALINNGELLGYFDGGFVIDQVSTGRIDLDGALEEGAVLADRTNIPGTEHSTITINGDQLHDEFNSSMRLNQGGTINMNLSEGWTMGLGSVLRFAGNQSYLNGGEVTLSGEVIAAVEGQGRINADAILTSEVDVELFRDGELEFHGETRILGGDFRVGEDGMLLFEGPTSVVGGAFATFSSLSADGSVQFNGATEYDGIVTIDGIARQNGDADIDGPTTINADILDMDGSGSTTWVVRNGLTINTAGVDSTISNAFDGTINIGGGFLPKITINLDDPAEHWTMAGELNLSGLAIVPFPISRVAGSRMRVTGQLNTANAIGISAPVTFDSSSQTTFATPEARLILSGASTIRPDATFLGQGTLVITSPVGMTLENGASLDEVGLENAGLLEIGDSTGVAAVDRFENTEDGTWLVEIGGHNAGDEHDLLLVTDGETQLDGLIEVDLLDLGSGLFLPEIGDEFTVLTSFGAVSGAFTNDPVSFAAGQSFIWEVLHHPHDVTLRLVDISIVPEPSALLLATLCLTGCWTMRRPMLDRKSLGVLAGTVCALMANPSQAVDREWVALSNGFWSTATNWSPNGSPGATDTVYLGNLPAIENTDAILNQDEFASEVHITDGMTLGTGHHQMTVFGDTHISGFNLVPIGMNGVAHNHSRIFVRRGVGTDDYDTDNLFVADEGRVRLYQGGILEIDETLSVDSSSDVVGNGIINFVDSGIVYDNNGTLEPFSDGLVLNVLNGGSLDLDGSTGNGRLLMEYQFRDLTFNGGTLTDSFSGEITIDGDSALQMNLAAPWEADENSEIYFGYNTNGISPGPAVINGVEVTIAGLAQAPYGTHGRINAPVTYSTTADVEVLDTARLEMNSMVKIAGGQFDVGEDGDLDFDGPTTVNGGTFSTFSNFSADGSVNFHGTTTWDGVVTINGIARQNGDADVDGPTTINAGILDMDGGSSTTWDVASGLTINAAGIDSTISNSFDGTFNIGGGFASKLSIHLADPADHWTMAGDMNLSGLAVVPFSITRVTGSHMRVTGDLSVSHLVRVNATTTFDNSSETTFADSDTRLILNGASTVRPNATFLGQGTLVNASTEGMHLQDGASLDEVGLLNAGLLEVGDSSGVAAVKSFENAADGTWLVQIGGHIAGDEHDLLLVTDGEALLDGSIEVDLIDVNSGLFLPEIGDEFTVLTSFGAVSGAFTNEPVSFVAGQAFHWEVLYLPHDATLKLVAIENMVPEPASSVLLSLAAISLLAGRDITGQMADDPTE